MEIPPLASSQETGKLGIKHLKRFWSKSFLKKTGKISRKESADEFQLDATLLSALGLGLEPTMQFLFQQSPDFEAFELWVSTQNPDIDQQHVTLFNRLFDPAAGTAAQEIETVLSDEELAFWDENGYFIIRNAVPEADCQEVVELICGHIGADLADPSTWYKPHADKQSIMIQLFKHPALEKNRRSARIRKVYEQLWGRTDLWPSTDRVSFNPPETALFPFQGPRLHWDSALRPPLPFGLQGLLYLTDTAENQGAFTLVPGFHKKIDGWLRSLPEGCDPHSLDLYAFGPKPIAANAGDFIVWHHALPHGASPNTHHLPRIVQYINYFPATLPQSSGL
jgi:hypothetical protein